MIENFIVFMLEGSISFSRFILASNIIFGNMLSFVLEVNLRHTRLHSPCNVFFVGQ